MKSMRPPSAAIFFMTYFHRAGGSHGPFSPPRIRYWKFCLLSAPISPAVSTNDRGTYDSARTSAINHEGGERQKKIRRERVTLKTRAHPGSSARIPRTPLRSATIQTIPTNSLFVARENSPITSIDTKAILSS